MWILKLITLNLIYLSIVGNGIYNYLLNFYFFLFNSTAIASFFFQSSIFLPQNYVIFFFFKLLLSLMILILVRGGTPRYRYDYLTKLGWLKFLGLSLTLFVALLFCVFLF